MSFEQEIIDDGNDIDALELAFDLNNDDDSNIDLNIDLPS